LSGRRHLEHREETRSLGGPPSMAYLQALPAGLPTPWLVDGGRGLPVFSFEEEAEAFLRSRGSSSGGWTVREAGAEELLVVLLGPAGAVTKKVLLDPIPGVADRVSSCLVGIGRERFVGRLLEQFRRAGRYGQRGRGGTCIAST
jgi:hypothetical protein